MSRSLEALPTIARAQVLLGNGEISAVELMDQVLARIDQVEPEINAWIHLDPDGARVRAKAADRRKRRPPLFGIPICVKDVIDVAGMPTTAGSVSWSRVPVSDATAVARLRAAGAIVVGKGNTNEFAYGIDGRNRHWGDCRNPNDPARMAGGSSSGPAAATASGMALGGIGTDASGSIRVPAALCGVVGMRPTHGLIPMDGVFPLAPTYDVVGPLARTVEDAAILTSVLLGRQKVAVPGQAEGVDGLRIGVAEGLADRIREEMISAVERVVTGLQKAGAAIDRVRISEFEQIAPVHQAIQGYEAAKVHAGWFDVLKDEYEPAVRERLETGMKIPASEYQDAQGERKKFVSGFSETMEGCDVLVVPTTPITAPPLEADDVRTALLSCVMPLSQLQWPVVTVPAGRINGLPAGLQILGRPSTESLVLRVAAAIEAGEAGEG